MNIHKRKCEFQDNSLKRLKIDNSVGNSIQTNLSTFNKISDDTIQVIFTNKTMDTLSLLHNTITQSTELYYHKNTILSILNQLILHEQSIQPPKSTNECSYIS
jgi:hypothetical protein